MSIQLNRTDRTVTVGPSSAEAEALVGMRGLIFGFFVTQSIRVAAELGIADRLANDPSTPADLSTACGVKERPLYRVLRTLAGEGVFAEDGDGRFHLTPLAELLRSDHPRSLRDWVLYVSDLTYGGAPGLLESVKSGEPAFAKTFGLPLFEFLNTHPEKSVNLFRAMSSVSAVRTAALVETYDFSAAQWLLDIGGAHGATTAAIAQKYPSVRCTCIDRPNAEQGALRTFTQYGVSDRCNFIPADFFQDDFPAGPDTYLLTAILHDWDDQHCLTLLGNCRRQMSPTDRLLVTDIVLSSERNMHDTSLNCMDLAVMTQVGGMERTESEFRKLLGEAGFDLLQVVDLGVPQSLLIARPC